MRRPARALAAGAILLSLAACGSTVRTSSGLLATGDPGSTLSNQQLTGLPGAQPGTTSDGTQAAAGGQGGGSVPTGVGAASASQGSQGGQGGQGAATGGTQGRTLAATGKGWDAKLVYLGVVTTKDTQKIYASLGAKNLDPGDPEAQANAVAKDINAHGGVLGRQVKVAFYDIKTLETAQNPDTTAQAVCTHFTQDRPVVAVYTQNTQLDVPTLHTCFARAKVPLLSAGTQAKEDGELHQLAPYFFSLAMASWNRLAPALVTRLQAQGWFTGWNTTLGAAGSAPVKVGILIDGSNEGTRTGQALKSALAAGGHPGALVFQYKQASDGQSASVNYFKGNGVTHVIVTNVELTAFQSSAAAQSYKPRYGITTYNDPYTNLEASGLTPKGANDGAMGIGWAPAYDVSDSNSPTPAAGERQCMSVQATGGQSFAGNKRIARGFAESVCDFFYLTARGANGSGGLDGLSIGQEVAKVGTTYNPAIGFAAALSGGRDYVPGKARDLAYVSSCSCFRYGTGTVQL